MKLKTRAFKLIISLGCGIFFLLMTDGNLCVFKRIFGLPCPGCGLTRAILCLLRFDLKNAFFYHPLFLVPPFLGLLLAFRKKPIFNSIYCNNVFWRVLAVLLITVWVIRMILLFPSTPPFDFNPHALVPRALHFLASLWSP
jgi:hypothetical protein